MQTLILTFIILASSIPLAGLLYKLTKDEKSIYKKPQYFPSLLWILAILSAIFYSINIKIALTLTFMFLLIFVWSKK